MAQSEDLEQKQTAAFVWLIVAVVIGIALYLSYFFSNKGTKKKERKYNYYNDFASFVERCGGENNVPGSFGPLGLRF